MARKSEQKAPNWKDIEKKISKFGKTELTELLRDLYQLSPENKAFFFTRFSVGEDPLSTYKKVIQNAMNPYLEDGETLEIETANDAIDQYAKAANNPCGEAELRIFYVECGNNFILSYQYSDEDLYDEMQLVCQQAIETVLKLPPKEREIFKTRLRDILKSANDIGWGYYDGFCDLYYEAFPDDAPLEQ